MATSVQQYKRRKHRSNYSIKRTKPAYRAIINRSNKYVVLQVVDGTWKTLVMMSDKSLTWETKTDRAHALGQIFAKKLIDKWVNTLVFDRNGYIYHWRVKACCEGMRVGGITI